MTATRCPQCQAEAKTLVGTSYCENCGWNVSQLREKVGAPVWAVGATLAVIFVFASIPLIAMFWGSRWFLVALSLVAVIGWLLCRQFRKHQEASAQFRELQRKFPAAASNELPAVRCPRCGTQAVRAGAKPYCLNCGWNVQAAEEHLRRNLRPSIGSLFGVLVFIVTTVEASFVAAAFYLLFFGAAQAGVFLWSWRELRRFLAERPREFKTPPVRARKLEIPEPYRPLFAVSRPRRVQMKKEVRQVLLATPVYFVLAIFLVVTLRDWLPKDFRNFRDALKLLFVLHVGFGYLLLLARGVREAWRGFRDRRLLTRGELVLAKVLSQSGSVVYSKLFASEITYELLDLAGRAFQGKSLDQSGQFFEEMLVPVFYDPEDPNKSVAISGANFELTDAPMPEPALVTVGAPQESWFQSVRVWFSGGRGGS